MSSFFRYAERCAEGEREGRQISAKGEKNISKWKKVVCEGSGRETGTRERTRSQGSEKIGKERRDTIPAFTKGYKTISDER